MVLAKAAALEKEVIMVDRKSLCIHLNHLMTVRVQSQTALYLYLVSQLPSSWTACWE